jgi:outer membrane protein, heavy metal efflux system
MLPVLLLTAALQASQESAPLPEPLRLEDVARIARERRQEIVAARAAARAGAERPAVVSALEDPMVMASVDHLPFELHGVDTSVMIEQRFPLSRERRNRGRVAEAEARRLVARSAGVALDVELEAVSAFLMLYEERRLSAILREQESLASQIVSASQARYASGSGTQADLLRATAEAARLSASLRASSSTVAAAEAMLNASLGRPAVASVPALTPPDVAAEPPPREAVVSAALERRPELTAGRAEVARARAEVDVMRSMDAPMAVVRLGAARTMAEGPGVMALLGLSIPIYRNKRGSAIREASAMAEMASADLVAMGRMIEGEAVAARDRVAAARTQLLATREEVVPRARQALEATLASYAAGRTPLVSVLDAATALWTAQADEVSAEVALAVAAARLARASGGGRPAGKTSTTRATP